MYRAVQSNQYQQTSGLGFSLKPPKWLRNLVSGAANVATESNTAVQAVNASYAPIPTMNVAPQAPSWLVPAAIGVGLLLVLGRRRG